MQTEKSKSAAKDSVKQFYKPGRRLRATLSCDACRARKLKCNREQPCQNCTTRGEQSACKWRGSKIPGAGVLTTDPMQQRINRLESLVKNLMSQNQQPTPPEDREPPSPHPSLEEAGKGLANGDHGLKWPINTGTTVIAGSHSVYKASDNWSDVLQEVSELKRLWNQSQDEATEKDVAQTLSHTVDGSAFLSGQTDPVKMTDLIAALPPRTEVDRLIKQYFDHRNFAIATAPVIHKATFMREYEEHWGDPSGTSVMWLGLLFSILAITMLSYHLVGNEPQEYKNTSQTLYQRYRLKTAQCLMKGDIAKCLPYTLETLLLNTTAELARRDDNSRGLWMMTGVMMRTAINMGYHRDPSSIPSITILQAELRRRIWLAIVGKDELSSFMTGFPSMMSGVFADTLEPRNLHDWEISEDTTELPPSRPLTESTPVTYLIAKQRLLKVLGQITDMNNALKPADYDKVIELDNRLNDAYNDMPPHMLGVTFEAESLSRTAAELSSVQMKFMYHRGLCALHRKYVGRGRLTARFKLSRDRCISSALELLTQQQIFHQVAHLPGSVPCWYNVSHSRECFILAAMILCLELDHRRRDSRIDTTPKSSTLTEALNHACTIWGEIQDSSPDAGRVYRLLSDMMLSFESGSNAQMPIPDQSGLDHPYHETLDFEPQDWHGFENMDIDWASWDSFIEGIDFDNVYQEVFSNDDSGANIV